MTWLLKSHSYVELAQADIVDLPEQFLQSFEAYLHEHRARNVQREDLSLEFTGGPFRMVSGLNQLNAIPHARVTLERHNAHFRVSYKIDFTTQILVYSSLAVALCVIKPFLAGAMPVFGVVVVWICLVIALRLCGKISMRRIVERCAGEIGTHIVKK